MNDEQRDLARRLAAHPRWVWRRGVLALEDPLSGNWQPGDREWRIITGAPDVSAVTSENEIHETPYMPSAFARAVPDLTDAATGGVLLDMLDYTRFGWLVTIGVKHGVRRWAVYERGDAEPGMGWCPTLAEACARALLAEWGEP